MKFRHLLALTITVGSLAFNGGVCGAAEKANTEELNAIKARVELDALRGVTSEQDLAQIQTVLRQTPDDPDAHFVAGEALNSKGFQNLAIEQFDLSCRADEKYFLKRWQALMQRSKDYAFPIAYYAVSKWPNDSSVLYIQGRRAQDQGHRSSAAAFYEKALEAKPVWPKVYPDLALFLMRENRLHESLKYANTALQQDPKDYVAGWVKYVDLSRISGTPEKYVKQLQQAFNEGPTNDEVAAELAKAYIRTQQYKLAVEPALSGIKYGGAKTAKSSEESFRALLPHLTRKEILTEIDQVSPPLSRDITSTMLRMRVARILSSVGNHTESVKLLLSALQMSSFFAPTLNYRIGEELDAMRADREALFYYQMAHELQPKDTKYASAYLRAAARMQNKDNDLARRFKVLVNPKSHS